MLFLLEGGGVGPYSLRARCGREKERNFMMGSFGGVCGRVFVMGGRVWN